MGRCKCGEDTGWGGGKDCGQHRKEEFINDTLDKLLTSRKEIGGYIGSTTELQNYAYRLNQLAFKEILERLDKIENTLSSK